MLKLNFPDFKFRIEKKEGKPTIFDEIRKKFLILSPEEWVRQNLIKFLIQEKNVPAGLIVIEKGLKVNQLNKRTDIVIYKRDGKAGMIVECKAPSVKISQATFEQIARYNMSLRVPLLVVSNGLEHYCCKIDFEKEQYSFLKDIPTFDMIL
jgi:type I site-specific restriction endonuclease